MEVARGLDLSFRAMDLRHDCFEQHGIFGHGNVSMYAQAMKAGSSGFCLKPFRDNELLECVERALAPSASNDSAARRKTEVM